MRTLSPRRYATRADMQREHRAPGHGASVARAALDRRRWAGARPELHGCTAPGTNATAHTSSCCYRHHTHPPPSPCLASNQTPGTTTDPQTLPVAAPRQPRPLRWRPTRRCTLLRCLRLAQCQPHTHTHTHTSSPTLPPHTHLLHRRPATPRHPTDRPHAPHPCQPHPTAPPHRASLTAFVALAPPPSFHAHPHRAVPWVHPIMGAPPPTPFPALHAARPLSQWAHADRSRDRPCPHTSLLCPPCVRRLSLLRGDSHYMGTQSGASPRPFVVSVVHTMNTMAGAMQLSRG